MDQLTLWFCSRQETEELFNSLSMSEQGSWRSSSRARHFHYKSSHQVFSDKTFPSIPVFFPVLRENTYCFTDKKHGPKCWLTLKESIQCPLFLSVFVCYPGKILDPWTEFMELWVRDVMWCPGFLCIMKLCPFPSFHTGVWGHLCFRCSQIFD